MARMSSQNALQQLRLYLDNHSFGPGDKLPSERVLSNLLGCSRQTLRNCLKILQGEGVLWQHVGQGTFMGHAPLSTPIRETILFEATSPFDIMEARLLLEPQVAAEAARKATAEDVSYLRKCIEKCKETSDPTLCEQEDDAFHCALARLSQNPILTALFKFLSGARRRATWQRQWQQTYRHSPDAPYQLEQYDQHKAIVDAIEEKDPEKARHAMATHMKAVCSDMRFS